jgi:hypothetical protein
VPDAFWECQKLPVPAGDALLLACGWGNHGAHPTAPVLIALDARSGRHRFRLDVPVLRPGASEGQTSPPALAPHGGILVPVYQWESALTVYVLDADGRTRRQDELGHGRMADLHLRGGDLGPKLLLGRACVAGGTYLLSWIYRSRNQHLVCRQLSTGEPRWETAEWLVGCAGGVAVGETDPPRHQRRSGAEVIARAVSSGHEKWRLAPEHALEPEQPGTAGYDPRPPLHTVAGAMGDAMVYVDRAARCAALLRRERDVLAAAVESELDEPDFDQIELGWDREHADELVEALVACDLAHGKQRWRAACGEVVSVACGPHACCAVALDRGGGAELQIRDTRGDLVGRAQVPLEPGDRRPAARSPRAVALDDELLLWASSSELVCCALARPHEALWRLPLPEPCECDPPRVRDRVLHGASIAVADERIYLRDGRRVWGLAAD